MKHQLLDTAQAYIALVTLVVNGLHLPLTVHQVIPPSHWWTSYVALADPQSPFELPFTGWDNINIEIPTLSFLHTSIETHLDFNERLYEKRSRYFHVSVTWAGKECHPIRRLFASNRYLLSMLYDLFFAISIINHSILIIDYNVLYNTHGRTRNCPAFLYHAMQVSNSFARRCIKRTVHLHTAYGCTAKIFSPVLSVSLNFKFRLRRALPKTCTALILICSVGRYASINTNKYVLVGTGIITS